MYLPIDPKKINGYWEKTKEDLKDNKLAYIISKGQYNSESITSFPKPSEIDDLIVRLKDLSYVRIGSNHLNPIPPHFAINLISSERGILEEFITSSNSKKQIESDLCFVSDFVFFELPNLQVLEIPFQINFDIEKSLELEFVKDKTIIRRKLLKSEER